MSTLFPRTTDTFTLLRLGLLPGWLDRFSHDTIARVSPVSRSRKKKPKRRTKAVPSPEQVFSTMLDDFRPALAAQDPLLVELAASELLGALWHVDLPEIPIEDGIAAKLIDFASRRPEPQALGVLRAFEVVAPEPQLRAAAAEGAARLAAAGVAEPAWQGEIGREVPGESWALTNVFGDQETVLCYFGEYGVVAEIDQDTLDVHLTEMVVTDAPDAVLADMRANAELAEYRVEPISAATARELLQAGIDHAAVCESPENEEDFAATRAFVLARCRTMPEPEPPVVTPAEIDAIVAEFLASPQASDLPDDPVVRDYARSIAEFGAERDRGRPLRLSPGKTEILVDDWLETRFEFDDALEETVAAWLEWAGLRNGLPQPVIEELLQIAFDDQYEDSAIDVIFAGLSDVEDPAQLAQAAARRLFAMPHTSAVIDGEDYPQLNPNDPDERRLLILGEHPEYQPAFDDPDALVDGVDPRMHITVEEVIINQLWDNTPPEAWQAAQRLIAAGHERHEILMALAYEFNEHLYAALQGKDFDLQAYVDKLNELGR
jgi:hypothetical protein